MSPFGLRAGHRPAIEIVGPPGSGKSTLMAALQEARPDIALIARYDGVVGRPAYARATLSIARELGAVVGGRPSRRELEWMVRVAVSAAVLDAGGGSRASMVAFAQGPLYTLARLAPLVGPEGRVSVPRARGWWLRELRRWRDRLDGVILLDADDDVLLERIHGRDKHHALQGLPDGRARVVLADWRARYEMMLSHATGPRVPGGAESVIRFDTAVTAAAIIAELVADRFTGSNPVVASTD